MNPQIMEGFVNVVLDPFVWLLIVCGVAIGIVFGSIPGLTATMAVVMFLPMTYVMEPTDGLCMLVALFIGGISGGLISAILLNIPGTPASVATCFDGSPLAKQGQAGKALGVGIVYSFIGTLIGVGLLIFISPYLAQIAIQFSAYEYCTLALFSLSLVIALTGKDIVILMERIRDKANAERYDRMIAKREEQIAEAKKQIEELQNISEMLRSRQAKLKRDISLIDDILQDGKMSEAHLKMLVEKILVHEEDGKLDLEIRLKAPFRDHLDIFENGERTDSILSAEFDYDRLGAIIYGDYYAG